MATVTRVPAGFDVSNCLRDGVIMVVDGPNPNRIIAADRDSALLLANNFRHEEIRALTRDNSEQIAELAEVNDKLRLLQATRDAITAAIETNRGEINRLRALEFTVQ